MSSQAWRCRRFGCCTSGTNRLIQTAPSGHHHLKMLSVPDLQLVFVGPLRYTNTAVWNLISTAECRYLSLVFCTLFCYSPL